MSMVEAIPGSTVNSLKLALLFDAVWPTTSAHAAKAWAQATRQSVERWSGHGVSRGAAWRESRARSVRSQVSRASARGTPSSWRAASL
ncbi:hypothetical protein, partial [Azospirillum soli]|uniref:hypothetical protein n=1 Tax=Azospirillum soli TaxID=1304799 RepID=UPI001AE874F1